MTPLAIRTKEEPVHGMRADQTKMFWRQENGSTTCTTEHLLCHFLIQADATGSAVRRIK
jgi:hypothetical protein